VIQLEQLRNRVVQDIFFDQESETCDVSDDRIISTLEIYLLERTDCQKKITVIVYIFIFC